MYTKGNWEIAKQEETGDYKICLGKDTIATITNWVNAPEE